MTLVKNTYGLSIVLGPEIERKINPDLEIFTGSSLNRVKQTKKYKKKKVKKIKPRSMSARTKSKIRKKIMAFSQLHKRMTFITFTFLNSVEDQEAIKVLRKFIDNIKKRKNNFEYIWVAERQTNNKMFKDNIHFHMIANTYLKAKNTCDYWIDLQLKNGITPRDENFKPSSALDIKSIATKNPKHLSMYLTKYVTKNKAEFLCQVWNCSKGVSRLYTDFYSNQGFLDQLYRLYGDRIKKHSNDYCDVHLIPIDKQSLSMYEILKQKNETIQT